jgi:hypothetical protein
MPNQYTGLKGQRLDKCRQYIHKFLDSFADEKPKAYRAFIPEILDAIRYLLIIEGVYHRAGKVVMKEPAKEQRTTEELTRVEAVADNIPVELLIEQAREEAKKREEKQTTESVDESTNEV